MAARGGLPVGFVFKPSPEELVGYFLDAKLSGKVLSAADYPQFLDYDIYSDHPRNIMRATRNRRCVQEGEDDVSGYFFTPLKKTTAKGTNISRRIEDIGTWLEKADTKPVYDQNMKKIGRDKYYKFTPVVESEDSPLNEDEWQMHEYTHLSNLNLALCRITKKVAAPDRIRAKKRSGNSAILESDYEARACKQSRVEHGSSKCLPSIINHIQHAGHKVINYNLQQQFPPMPHGSVYGPEPTTVDALTTGKIPNIISLDEQSDGDDCEAWDPYVAKGGQFDEYCNPEQHTLSGIEATTDDPLTQDRLNLMSVNEENDDTDVCEVIDPYVSEGGQCDEFMNNNPDQHTASGVEATTDDSLTQEILDLMSVNENDDTDVCEVIDQYGAEGGQLCDESMNYNPDQHTASGVEATTDDALTQEIVNLMSVNEENDDTDVCEIIDPYIAEGGQYDESMNNNLEQHTASGVETMTDEALADEILNLISVDVENDDIDVCEVTYPCIAEGGQCDEYDRVTSQIHSSASECLNYPELPTATGAEYSSSVCMNSNDLNLTTVESQIVEGEQCTGQGTSTNAECPSSEFMQDILQVQQEDSQVSKIQEQAFLSPQSCAGQYNYFAHATCYDYSNFVGPAPFEQEEEYTDFNWYVDLWTY